MADKAERLDVYQEVTDRIVAALEEGTIPWHKPWAEAGAQRNLKSGKEYRGVNQLLLGLSDYGSPYWLTFRQAKDLGGSVRKGERSSLVVFWKMLKRADQDTGDEKLIPMLRHYRVFNVSQCDGLEVPQDERETRTVSPIAACQSIVAGYRNGPTVEHGGSRACYSPARDAVMLPNQSAFESDESYYSTAFHELVHSTGHESRLKREGLELETLRFGSPTYSREELIAELGAAMLAGRAGIVPATIDQSAAYVAGWLGRLRDDRKLIVSAAGRAQRAADRVLGIEFSG